MWGFSGKRAIITGASSGIGRALAVEAGRRQGRLILNARNADRLAETAEAVINAGGEAHVEVGDITCPDVRQRLVSAAEQQLGGLDVLVNNAGIGATGHFREADADRLRTIMETNFFAPAELTRLAIPHLMAGNEPAILMINSVVGRRGIPSRVEYSASKYALMGLSEALRAELARDDIQLTVVSPGLTQSSFEDNMLENKARKSLHAERSMSADEAAKLTLDALQRGKNEVTLTFKGKLLQYASRFLPRFVDYKMAKVVRGLYAEEIEARKNKPAKEAVS